MLDYVALQRTIMYSYSVNMYNENLDKLVALAKSGDIKAAREGLRTFTKKHPNKLIAWKFLADLASSTKERSDAIRRAQLLAPGDPWVIEAKKQSKPPGYKQENYNQIKPSTTLESQNIANEEINDAIEAPTEANTIAEVIPTATYRQPSSESIHASNLDTYVQKEQLTIKTRKKSEQPGWLIWVASIMGIVGLALLYVAWSMS